MEPALKHYAHHLYIDCMNVRHFERWEEQAVERGGNIA
jgi:hypothetical protein